MKLREFISIFTDKKDIYKNIVCLKDSYFSVPEKLKDLSSRENVITVGTYLGKEKKEIFVPSTILLDKLAELSERKIFLNEKTSWLFLCKRDVFLESIEKANVDEGFVLVQNMNDENLGYGKFTTKGRKTLVKNLFDKGDFLRRERK